MRLFNTKLLAKGTLVTLRKGTKARFFCYNHTAYSFYPFILKEVITDDVISYASLGTWHRYVDYSSGLGCRDILGHSYEII